MRHVRDVFGVTAAIAMGWHLGVCIYLLFAVPYGPLRHCPVSRTSLTVTVLTEFWKSDDFSDTIRQRKDRQVSHMATASIGTMQRTRCGSEVWRVSHGVESDRIRCGQKPGHGQKSNLLKIGATLSAEIIGPSTDPTYAPPTASTKVSHERLSRAST